MDVALVTCAALPGLHADDRHLLDALRVRGLDAEPVVWEDPHQNWSEPRLAVIRSAWDYSYRRNQFMGWVERAARSTRLWNSPGVVRWNTHKRYLCDLAERGVSTVPTVLLAAGSQTDLGALLRERGWEDAVVKAAVAQAGRYAKRVSLGWLAEGQAHLDRFLPHEDMLVQPYVQSVVHEGELSLIFVEGEFTHAVRKQATSGDFRVHDDYGGSVDPEQPSSDELAIARAALESVGEPTLYGRVDLVADRSGSPMVMECELVEPELFLRFSPDAVDLLSDAIERRLPPSFHCVP